jgi:uncharacterized repeat protein (TIGR01451 family)
MMREIYHCSSIQICSMLALSKSIKHNPNRLALCYVALVAMVLAIVPAAMSSLDVSAPSHLTPGSIAKFAINVTNSGETPLDLAAVDTLPVGLSYISDDRGGSARGRTITWKNLGHLDVGDSTRIHLVTRIGPCIVGMLENLVAVSGTPPTGYNVTDSDIEDIFVTAPTKEPARKIEHLDVGNQEALAVSPPGNLGTGSRAVAENNRLISLTQD